MDESPIAPLDSGGMSLGVSSLATALRATACAVLVLTSGCGLAPSVNVLGSFFPAWLISIVTGIVLTVLVRQVFVATKIAPYLRPAGLVYPSLAALLIFAAWLVLFGN
ncbi:MAG TPA: YtcA family lipoprotein [Candidatus Margulisiibacteriota bacterium]|nr:YtcA family lipoprotein [Candidatus Margulisiibacteriota bacterium]